MHRLRIIEKLPSKKLRRQFEIETDKRIDVKTFLTSNEIDTRSTPTITLSTENYNKAFNLSKLCTLAPK